MAKAQPQPFTCMSVDDARALRPKSEVRVDFGPLTGRPDADKAVTCHVVEVAVGKQGGGVMVHVSKPNGDKYWASPGRFVDARLV